MDLETTFSERVLHFVLFCAFGLAVGVAGFAALERLTGAGARAVRLPHILAALALFGALLLVEQLYHAVA